jgi:hypothetical protein
MCGSVKVPFVEKVYSNEHVSVDIIFNPNVKNMKPAKRFTLRKQFEINKRI